MSLHTTTRVAVDDEYVALVGKAVYVFASYEWSLIWIIDHLQPGFVAEYSRGTSPMTSGTVKNRLKAAITTATDFSRVSHFEFQDCLAEFEKQIVKRNALIHAHPATDTDGSQILAYQSNSSKPLPDMKWPKAEVVAIIAEFDACAVRASTIHEKLRA